MERIVSQITAAGTAVSNTTTETSLARKTFAPGDLAKGKIYKGRAACRATSTNSSDTATPKLRFGTSATPGSNTLVATGAAVDETDNDVGIVDWTLECQTATRAVISGFITDVDATGSKLVNEFVVVLTIDQTLAYNLDYTATWSAASASDSIQAEQAFVTELVS